MKTISGKVVDKFIREYVAQKTSAESLAHKYSVDPRTIINHLKRRNIPIRWLNQIKTLNDSYFHKIDTEAKAYFLGLMYADGCILVKEGRSKQLSINLQEKDRAILEHFIKELNYTGKLSFVNYRKYGKNYQNAFCLRLSSNKLCDDLIKLGCTPRKSLILKWPTKISKKLMRHFIRGYFDGDGYISFMNKRSKTLQHSIGFCGTKRFLTGLSLYFTEKLNCDKRNIYPASNSRSYKILYGGNLICKKIFDHFYNNATIFLKRKREKFKYFPETLSS